MELGRLRRYDVQAGFSFALSLLSVGPLGGAVVLVLRNYNNTLGQIVYGEKSPFVMLFLACILTSLLPAVCGMALGWSSAGQRRNDRPARSWTGFFVGGAALTLNVILLLAFLMLRLEKPV